MKISRKCIKSVETSNHTIIDQLELLIFTMISMGNEKGYHTLVAYEIDILLNGDKSCERFLYNLNEIDFDVQEIRLNNIIKTYRDFINGVIECKSYKSF